MKALILLLLPICFLLASCQSGSKRYEYPPSRLASPQTVKAASIDGRFILLEDGSTWNIDWNDASKARNWAAGDRVNVIATQGKSFPYMLIKQGTGQRVAARYGKKL